MEGEGWGLPMNDAFGVHIVDGVNQLSGIVAGTRERKGAKPDEDSLHLAISGKVENEI